MENNTLSVTRQAYLPPSLHPMYMGAYPPSKCAQGSLYQIPHVTYFNNYRNEKLSRFTMPPDQWGIASTPYSSRPDLVAAHRMRDWRNINPQIHGITLVDGPREINILDFYKSSQLHREQYKDRSGCLAPLSYYIMPEIVFQCPYEPTKAYLKTPTRYARMHDIVCLPVTLDRVGPLPPLPDRCLAARYNNYSDRSFGR